MVERLQRRKPETPIELGRWSRWLVGVGCMGAWIGLIETAASQSPVHGHVLLKEDFSSGVERANQWSYWVNGVIEELPRPEPIGLVIVAGQSNAVGYDARPEQLPADPRDKDVLFWWRCGDPPADGHDSTCGGKWTQLQPQPLGMPRLPKEGRQYGNFAQKEGGFGPEIGFARELRGKEPDRKLAIVKVAFSGTGLRTDWNPLDSGDGGSCYRALINEVRAALRAGREQGLVFRPRALVWVQGESDATPHDAESYAVNLEALVRAIRGDLAAKDMTVLLAVNTRFKANPEPNPLVMRVVEAQKQVAKTLRRCGYVDTSSATIANAEHFDAAGTLDVGRRFAEALLAAEAVVPAAPTIVRGGDADPHN